MLNWRRPVIYSLLRVTGKIPDRLKEMASLERLEPLELKRYVDQKLSKLILHAYNNVPFYKERFDSCGLVKNNFVNLGAFESLLVLRKTDIAQAGEKLYSIDHAARKSYKNSTGGSSGVPVQFLQDREYSDWNIANTIYYKKAFANQQIGDKELRLWGSERDLMYGQNTLSARLKNWLYNRVELNAFTMTAEKMAAYVEAINNYRPRWIEAYVQPMTELARFIQSHKLKVHSPAGILTSAGTLYPDMRETIETAFGTKVYNRYGGREAGGIACSCGRNEMLHISVWNSFVEVLDDELKPARAGVPGRIYITTLNNFSMPLIRYEIGDMAILSNEQCSCGRTTPLLSKVIGRHIEVFRTRDGAVIPAEFFIHFIGVVYNKGYIEKFQAIQRSYDEILIRVVISDRGKFVQSQPDLVNAIKKVMGPDCVVRFEEVSNIEPLANGKYLYTVCEVQ